MIPISNSSSTAWHNSSRRSQRCSTIRRRDPRGRYNPSCDTSAGSGYFLRSSPSSVGRPRGHATLPGRPPPPRSVERHGTTASATAAPPKLPSTSPRPRLDFPSSRHRSRDRSPHRRPGPAQLTSRSPPSRSPGRRRFQPLEHTSSSRANMDPSRWRPPSRSRSPRRGGRGARRAQHVPRHALQGAGQTTRLLQTE